MIRYRAEQLEPGMQVAKPVYNSQNVLLLKAGTVLTNKNIQTLKAWGVFRIVVEGTDEGRDPGDGQFAAETDEAVEAGLKGQFADVRDDPVMEEIMRVAGLQIQKRTFQDAADHE